MKTLIATLCMAVAIPVAARNKCALPVTQPDDDARRKSEVVDRQYVSIGIGHMTDDMVAPWYQMNPVTYQVAIMQDADGGPYYRVLAPYGQAFADAMLTVNNVTLQPTEYDAQGVRYIDIDASDPEDVYFPKTFIGCDWGDGEMYIGITSTGTVTLHNGVFTGGRAQIAVGDNTGAVAMNRNGRFRIVLPGIELNDYDLAIEPQTLCCTDATARGSITTGADIAYMKYKLYADMQEDEILSAVQSTAAAGTRLEDADFTIPFEEKKVTLVVVGFDSEGGDVGYDWKSFYSIDASDEGWINTGNATLHENVLSTFYSNLTPQDLACTLQCNVDNPRMLRLVSPFAAHTHWNVYGHQDHPHYIYINAEDPELIFLEESPVCLDFGSGMVRISSAARYYIDAGFEADECKDLELGAVLEDGVLSFPPESIVLSMMDYDGADWYMADEDGLTTITLPENFDLDNPFVGVKPHTQEDSPVRYLNLQGLPVERPQSGVCIELRNGKACLRAF